VVFGPTLPTILVIDDSDTFRGALREAIQSAGYAVQDAVNGEEGLRRAATIRPAAIIVDGVMPGIDGATVIRRVRLDAVLRRTPCLLLTAADETGAELRALDSGADAFVRKEADLSVILARLAAVLRTAQPEPRETAALLEPKRVLVVDDSETYLNVIASMLRDEGYDVVTARSGEQGLEMLAVQAVDCVLLDLVMPGIGGKDTCRRIREFPSVRDVPVIIVTSTENREAMLESLGIGADDYIAKSNDFDVLKARVHAQIRRKQFEDENRRIREQLLRRDLEAAEARAAHQLAAAKAALAEELELKNRELEAFSYSVSHDLRSPLRSIDGFSLALLEDCGDQLDENGRKYLGFVRESAQLMARLIDDMLTLARVARSDMERVPIDLSVIARAVVTRLERAEPTRAVDVRIEEGMTGDGDPHLVEVVLENLLGNAWKFSSKRALAQIEMGATSRDGRSAYFVRDNGAGFDMNYAYKLFGTFQRLHTSADFVGTGIGLATVQRVIQRHGGSIWAEGAIDTGATFTFTLAASEKET
jgi:two-component system NtrC family sensor kinase